MSTITKQLFNLSISKHNLSGRTNVYNQVFRTVFNFAENEDSNIEKVDVEQLQNKSRLLNAHRNMLHGNLPYDQAQSWIHQTLKYKRKMYAKYGAQSGIDPSKYILNVVFKIKQKLICLLNVFRNLFPY